MSLAGGRAPRKTAGNRLSGLLEAEEEDEFYQTTYGGFTEESGDDEYQGDQSDTEDEVDSDFDIDEGDEPSSDGEAEEPRRKRRVVTKAYKEPLKSLRPRKVSTPAGSSQKTREEKALLPLELQDDGSDSEWGCLGQLTKLKYETVGQTWGLGRQELTIPSFLPEETYERLEADKKKQVHKKRKCPGPIITYHSVTVPLVGEPGPKEENVDVEGLDPAPTASALTPRAGTGPVIPPARCSRTFITFSDDATFEEWFPQGRPPKVPVQEVCPVTHRPALYRDPVTDIPYATARAFKIIREAYKKYITAHGLPPTASALGPGPPPPEPLPGSGPRALRQKIVIK
ncbi:vacuolar protein sorting-associated protein 72 homolog [Lagenorhynchus albirostris]|uniref:vacuolar protein sorting-associated protein 72 homolog n=1 Tax=Lagenorhynchus albirostris TaxID=27610 RepID=UPI0028EEAB23|nr:vacuolar protein sorting-associated protein 72 homolog [Lagenorhynchus albirostris]